jgi:hypothetical protein
MKTRFLGLAALSAIMAGCGGGGTGSGPDGGVKEDFGIGPFVGTGVATGKTVVTNSADYSAMGFSGTFSNLRIQSNSVSLGSIRLLASFGHLSGDDAILRLGYVGAGGQFFEPVGTLTNAGFPSMSPDGRKIVFTQILNNGSPLVAKLKIMNFDGTGLGNFTTPPPGHIDAFPAYSPSGTQVAFIRETDHNTDYELRKVTVASGAVSPPIAADASVMGYPSYSRDSKFVYYVAQGTDDTDLEAYRVSANGGVPEVVYDVPGTSVDGVIESPNGDGEIIIARTASDVKIIQIRGSNRVLLSTSGSVAALSPVPNSTYIAFLSSEDNGLDYKILDILTGQTTTIWRSGQSTGYMCVVPPQSTRMLAGPSGLFGSSLNGILATRQGAEVASVLGFRATTPGTVQISSLSGENTTGPNLDFEVTADKLTLVSFLDKDKTLPVKAVGTSPLNADGAFVSFDSHSGKVAAVIPYTGSRSRGTYKRQGQDSVFDGQLLAVIDGKGENLAPNGAASVRVRAGGQVVIER